MADLIGQTIDHYLIERYIGQGGMGSVFQARDISLGRQVAIKFIHPHLASQEKFQQQFLQQIRDAAAFDHPNIVRIFAHDFRDDNLYLVMEYIADGSLRDYLDQLQADQMRLDDMIQVASQAADALEYAHERGIIHRNLKPENILFKKRPTADLSTGVDAALADVGLAQLAAKLTGSTVGLPSAMFLYMAPEQALSQELDGRVDIYALGVLMYEMVAGRPPYQPRSITEAMQMKTQPIPPPSTLRPGLPPELDRIILECMAADPNARYQSADELLQDLRPLQTDRLRHEAIEVPIVPLLEDEREDTEPVQEIPSPEAPPAPVVSAPLPPPVVNGGDPYFYTEPEIEVPREGAERDQLIIVEDRRPTRTVTLDRDLMIIGRDEDCDIVLDHHRVSRRHARIERTPTGGYFIADLGTTNGTWLNNVRLAPEMETAWRPGGIVRVGDLWLTIETDDELMHLTEPFISEAPLPKPAPRPSPGGKVDAILIPGGIIVEPGGAANLALEIINDSDAAAHFMLEVQDIPPSWVTLPGHSIHVEAHESTTVSLVMHPLRASDSSVGLHNFTIVVKSLAQADVAAKVLGQLQITPFYEFSVDLQPKQVRSGQDTYVVISNLGNMPTYYRIAADVYQGDLEFELPGEAVSVGPGQRAHVPVRIRVRNRPLLLGDSITPFTLIVADELGVEWQQAGSVVASPIISMLLVSLMGLLALLACGVVALLAYVQYTAILAANETATSIAVANNLEGTRVAAQATFDASDPDNDDLTNAEELEVGTDAQIFDTDEDGLSDGREVNQSRTDPLDPDTDNDGLLDGVDPNPLVALDPSRPDDFVMLYYMQINDRDYDDAWAVLTDNFRYNIGLYNQQMFEDFWNDIEEVEIGEVRTVTEDADFACVFAELTYDLADGRTVPDDAPFIYLLNDGQGSWLINAKFEGHEGLG